MRSEPLASYPLVRVAQRPLESGYMASLGVSRLEQAKLYEAVLQREAIESLPGVIREVASDLSDATDARSAEMVEFLDAAFGSMDTRLMDLDDQLDRIDETLERGFATIIETLQVGFLQLATLQVEAVERLNAIEVLLESPLDTASRELRRRGLQAYGWGLFEEAAGDFVSSIERNPYDHVCYLHLGHISLMGGRLGYISLMYGKATEEAEHLMYVRATEEADHLMKEKATEAAEHYRHAVRYALAPPKGDPAHDTVRGGFAQLNLARCLIELGHFEEALQTASEADDLLPNRADVQFELTLAASLGGDIELAERAWRRCLEIDPVTFIPVAAAEKMFTFPVGPLNELRNQQQEVWSGLDHDAEVLRKVAAAKRYLTLTQSIATSAERGVQETLDGVL